MDIRIEPFGNHPDGGKIKEFSSNEEIPDYMLELSNEATKILENVPIKERLTYIINLTEPELFDAREEIKKILVILKARN